MILVGGCFTFLKLGLLLTLGAHVQRGGTVLGSCVSVLNLANFVKVYTGTALRP